MTAELIPIFEGDGLVWTIPCGRGGRDIIDVRSYEHLHSSIEIL